MDFTAYGGRRFMLSVASLWVCSALLMGGYITDSIYRDIVIATVAAYITGNTIQKVREANNESIDKRTPD